MKRILLTLVLAAALLGLPRALSAQAFVGAGYLSSSFGYSSEAVPMTVRQPGQGVYAGVGACLWLPVNGLSLESGLYGDYLRTAAGDGAVQGGADVVFVRLPLRFRYEYQFSYDTSLFLSAGPQGSYGVYGKGAEGDFFGDGIRRFDLAAGLEGGVKLLGHLQVKAGYDWGLMNLCASGDLSLRRDAFHAGIAYQF